MLASRFVLWLSSYVDFRLVPEVINGFADSSALFYFSLSINTFGPQGAKYLAPVIERNTSIEELEWDSSYAFSVLELHRFSIDNGGVIAGFADRSAFFSASQTTDSAPKELHILFQQ